ncbi:MAG: peptidoglycan bridge formation glycyltransferase FemA/FemB family protein [Cyanobium sp. MAG06]|nr:peptidoglycan bridge formation glycyltransferase FemA/FemB family protein [Cyanobium sp. MAG06]
MSSALEHSSFLQPRAEIIVPINKMGEDIINNFNKDVRYNIRSSEKKGVVNEIVKEDFNKYIDIFMSIISETTKRNKFNFHDKKYLEIIFNSLENIKNGFLSLSYVSGTVIGVGMYIIYNNNSFYLFAGSKTGYRKYLPGYSNIYSAIKYISENGLANNLSLGGISSTNHPNNNLKLLTEFKSD